MPFCLIPNFLPLFRCDSSDKKSMMQQNTNPESKYVAKTVSPNPVDTTVMAKGSLFVTKNIYLPHITETKN
jgi:hypothetical protein